MTSLSGAGGEDLVGLGLRCFIYSPFQFAQEATAGEDYHLLPLQSRTLGVSPGLARLGLRVTQVKKRLMPSTV